ncbi:MAG: CopG family transcriptional regulator [Acidobacteria bacterium]|nr:CopG family transcriptional regulator [Acidobacteriota bacterium]MCI0621424.1 CopG family transcriptional regulator [Acidobacteriota bacterium]MCI0724442.1 CopG family transcriptional regulator [Acidobacteriota bacterium]
MMPSERLSVRIDAAIRRNLSKEASRVSKSESDLVREALEAFLSKQASKPSCYDLAKELGIIGTVQRAPADLSANKKHFRRLGKRK